MMTCYIETPEMGVFILSDGMRKPFSVHSTADDDYFIGKFKEFYQKYLLQWCLSDVYINKRRYLDELLITV